MNTVPTYTLVGKTITSINSDGTSFTTSDGKSYNMHHEQSCCECVQHSHTIGDPKTLIGEVLTFANDDHCEPEPGSYPPQNEPSDYGSHTWTVFEFHTKNTKVQVWWLGESNGYYSEDVDLVES